MTESYTFASNEGMEAVVKKVIESGEPYEMRLNNEDFEAVLYAIRDSADIHTKDIEVSEAAAETHDRLYSLLNGIAESVGIEFI